MYTPLNYQYSNMQMPPSPLPQAKPNYQVGFTPNLTNIEKGMLISYNSSSMVGVIQSIPSGEEIFVEIGELSSMGIGIDFLYNLARIRLLVSFEKKYVVDSEYIVRPKATNLKIINIDVIQSEPPKFPQLYAQNVGYY